MKLPKFVFIYPATDLPGAGYILHTENPRIFARVLKFKREAEFLQHLGNYTGIAHAVVPGYNIDVVFAGSLGLISINPETKNQIQGIIDQMMVWYDQEKIKREPHKFTRYDTRTA